MFKRFFSVVLSFLFVAVVYFAVSTPVLSDFSTELEVYSGKNSSESSITSLSKDQFFRVFNKTGESCVVDGVGVNEFFDYFDAEIVFVETTSEGVNYYGFSPRVKYVIDINDKLINLHYFDGKDVDKVGSPIIFGSF